MCVCLTQTLRSLTLGVNPDDPMPRLGVQCLPRHLTSLTLRSLHVTPAPRGRAPVHLRSLDHLALKGCQVSRDRGSQWRGPVGAPVTRTACPDV